MRAQAGDILPQPPPKGDKTAGVVVCFRCLSERWEEVIMITGLVFFPFDAATYCFGLGGFKGSAA